MKEKESLAKKLLIIDLKHCMKITELESVLGGNCELTEVFPLELQDIALDLLGVPKDISAEHKEGFCRVWLNDAWYGYQLGDDVDEYVESYILWVKNEMLDYRMEYAN